MIYEYRCGECSQIHEFQMKMSDPHPEICPSCGSKNSLERVISRTAFALKGSGWYTTDYKRSASPVSSAAKSCAEKAAEGTACGGGACATPSKAESN